MLIMNIENIYYINLSSRTDRNIHMKKQLDNLGWKGERIEAVELENGRVGCTLSHIKAISSIKNLEGDYFMICEDDIALDNLCYFDIDLQKIIQDAPNDFDILMINKIYEHELEAKYVKWLDYHKLGGNKEIYGTGCYIIHRRAFEKINNYVDYIDDNHFDFKINKYSKFHVADIYLYRLLKTYVYKYNFINLLDQTSTIQDNHLDFHIKASKNQLDLILKDF